METMFILGAGFSRAISDAMPLTDELGNEVRRRLPDVATKRPHDFKNGYFEAWLSRLATATARPGRPRQPDELRPVPEHH